MKHLLHMTALQFSTLYLRKSEHKGIRTRRPLQDIRHLDHNLLVDLHHQEAPFVVLLFGLASEPSHGLIEK